MTSKPMTSSTAACSLQELERTSRQHDVTVAGCRVRWRSWGQGEPLVLLHGGHGNWAHWYRNIGELARHHALWLPDMPGFGDSGPIPGASHDPQHLNALVDILSASLDELLGPGAAIDLAGFSFGGLVAGSLAVRHPGVRRLALLGTAGHGGPRRTALQLVNWRLADRTARRQALRHNLAELMLHDPARIDALALEIHEQASQATRFRSKDFSQQMDLKDILAGFEPPVMLVWGEHDAIALPDLVAQRLIDGHAQRNFRVIPGAGHWVQFEAPEPTQQILLEWFKPEAMPHTASQASAAGPTCRT